MNWLQRLSSRPFFIRLFHWEFWSFGMVYGPIYWIWVILCLRSRSFFFFAAANPRIRNGGFLNESKKDVAGLIPSDLHPRTAFFTVPSSAHQVISALRQQDMRFPLIGKPDIGGRGRGVKTLCDENEIAEYVHRAYLDFHIQEFVPYKKEVGIFYIRYPGQEEGMITGIVRKEFLAATGDGVSTVRELLRKNKRALLQLPGLEKNHPALLDQILQAGEQRTIVPYGNHARGALFLDDSCLISDELTAMMDKICRRIPEFYFGRLDIRYDNWEDLVQGQRFSIIEVNGAGSEPTHIYDPKHSIFFAWKEIIRHWVILCRISRINHRHGHPYLGWKEGWRMFRENRTNSARLKAMTE